MKRVNREGPAILGAVAIPERVAEHRLKALIASGALVVDARPAADFAAGHIPGTLSIPFNRSFPTWAGSLLPYDRDLYLLVDEAGAGRLQTIVQSLSLIGLDRIRGYLAGEVLGVWSAEGGTLEPVEQLSVQELSRRRNGLVILDVRGRTEWEIGHLSGARLIPLEELSDRLAEVPADQPIAVHCESGSRSSIAAGLLLARGRRAVANVSGGIAAWESAGLPVEQ
jgi:hydroxyacylglutathione hydrolase